ncbi:MAG: stage 0 sporulation family protein [Clostridia bacterium]|nr:stage 0 sporulation family protein [Clostridia bacterium]
MATVVGVKFKNTNKIYYFNPGFIACAVGDQVVVETARGTEIGDVVMQPIDLDDDKIVAPLKNVVRKVTAEDLAQASKYHGQEESALRVFEEMIGEYKLEMKPVSVEYAFDGSKITFFFTADGRIDFRDLVKGLAHHFRARIELRQIGVRDEAKLLGGLGKCGNPICCKRFLTEFSPVTIKMAKEQNISLNPSKISGLCGRLMCCLNYEQAYYEETLKTMPRLGARVSTPNGPGVVTENNPISMRVKVKVEKGEDMTALMEFPLDELNLAGAPAPRPAAEPEKAPEEAEPAPRRENPRHGRPRNNKSGNKPAGQKPQEEKAPVKKQEAVGEKKQGGKPRPRRRHRGGQHKSGNKPQENPSNA